MSSSVLPHRRQLTRLCHPWDSPGKNTGVGCHFLLQCMKVKSESEVAQSCLTLSDPMTAAYQAPPSMGLSRQEYWNGAPLSSINSHGAGSAQSLTGHPDRHHDIPTCHPRGASSPPEWEITPRNPLSTASLSPMKGRGRSGNLSLVEQTRDLLWSCLTLHGQIQAVFFFFFF